jgi:tetratricopeptide (TPR) repeat protein
VQAVGASAASAERASAHVDAATAHLVEFEFDAALEACGAATACSERGSLPPLLDWQIAHVHCSVLEELGQFAAAARQADAAVALADLHHLEEAWVRSLGKRIWIARQQGDARLAARCLRQLTERLSPESHSVCAVVASTLVWLGRPETALYYARRCLDLATSADDRVRDHRELARVFARLDQRDEAAHHLELARAALPAAGTRRAERYMMLYAEYQLAMSRGDTATAERAAAQAADVVLPDVDNLRRHQALLGLAKVYRDSGRLDAMADTIASVDTHRLGGEHRALALQLEAAAAERLGDWRTSADRLAAAREILASRYLAMPTVLLIEAELAVAGPLAADLAPGGRASRVAEFNRAIASRDQLLLAAAKDLRGPIAVFEIGAELLREPDVDGGRVTALIERGLTEMELVLDQLRHAADDGPAGQPPTVDLGALLQHAAATTAAVAAARGLDVRVTEAGTPGPVEPGERAHPFARALTTALALAVRAAPRDTVLAAAVTTTEGAPQRVTIDIDCSVTVGSAPDALTAPTAGGPTAWGLATALVAEHSGALTAEWLTPGRVRLTLTAAPRA